MGLGGQRFGDQMHGQLWLLLNVQNVSGGSRSAAGMDRKEVRATPVLTRKQYQTPLCFWLILPQNRKSKQLEGWATSLRH